MTNPYSCGVTSIVFSARSSPARGPLSNSTLRQTWPAVCSRGTRTECAQNVPQAKPDCAAANSEPSLAVSAMRPLTPLRPESCVPR